MTTPAPETLADVLGPTLTDWLDTDQHRYQAWNLHQLIAAQHGLYVAAAWLIGVSHQTIRHGHSDDARTAAYAALHPQGK
ncbi:hypothetical protein [Streptomyces sioyaensis]|uniref:hypothetical protein n=1 Tax=Streptomyces sioyaensis TaxID=67364 RepID=UPI003788CDD2